MSSIVEVATEEAVQLEPSLKKAKLLEEVTNAEHTVKHKLL